MKKLANLTETEVAGKASRKAPGYRMISRPVFMRVKCLQDYPEPGFSPVPPQETIFAKDQCYDLWLILLQNKKRSDLLNYMAAVPGKEEACYWVPFETFGPVEMNIKETSASVNGIRYRLTMDTGGKLMLFPAAYLIRKEIESLVLQKDKDRPAPDKYMFIPRIFGPSFKKIFPAWEIRRYYGERIEYSYFNIFTGQEKNDWLKIKIQISIGSNQKTCQFEYLNIGYRKKQITLKMNP